MVLPAFVILLTFLLLPAIFIFAISVLKWDLIGDPELVGLRNYQRLLFRDPLWWKAFWQTVYFVVGTVPTGLALSLGLALLLRPLLVGGGLIRSAVFSPHVTPLVAVALTWGWIFKADYGILNAGLELVGLPRIDWLGDSRAIMPAMIIFTLWHNIGYNTVIFLAGLANIPKELEDAARVDGAGSWNVFRHVTWPLLSPTTYFVLLISVIGSFKVFVPVFVLTAGSGGPDRAALVIGLYLYHQAFNALRFGYAAAISVALFLIILAFTLFQERFASRRVFYQ